MKWAVLSDIHGNLPALEAVLLHANQLGVNQYVFTGDMVGHGPNPEMCIQQLKDKSIIGIKGNNDKALLSNDLNRDFYQNEANFTLSWAKKQLSAESTKWLRDQLSDSAINVGKFLTVVHGTLMDPIGEYTYMYDNDSNIKMSFRNLRTPIGIFGHTHRPVIYKAIPKNPPFLFSFMTIIPASSDSDRIALSSYNYSDDLKLGYKLLICAGSIGQPRDGDRRASYLIVDDEKQELQFCKISYDLEAVFADFERVRSQFPGQDSIIDDCIERLREGK